MAGNPDQQEDTPDDQYQDEMEDEVRKKKSLSHLFSEYLSVEEMLYNNYIRDVHILTGIVHH